MGPVPEFKAATDVDSMAASFSGVYCFQTPSRSAQSAGRDVADLGILPVPAMKEFSAVVVVHKPLRSLAFHFLTKDEKDHHQLLFFEDAQSVVSRRGVLRLTYSKQASGDGTTSEYSYMLYRRTDGRLVFQERIAYRESYYGVPANWYLVRQVELLPSPAPDAGLCPDAH